MNNLDSLDITQEASSIKKIVYRILRAHTKLLLYYIRTTYVVKLVDSHYDLRYTQWPDKQRMLPRLSSSFKSCFKFTSAGANH